jgi:N-acetylglucosamine kinase-like BadF-type ATPase
MVDNFMYIFGIDGGGTKTIGMIVAPNGEVKAIAEVGATNINTIGSAGVETEIKKLIVELKKLDNKAFDQISVIFAGMAGAGDDRNKEVLESIIRNSAEKSIPCYVDNDAISALYSGSLGQEGIVHISGTGSIAFGINREGKRERVGGWGYIIDAGGSGFSIGQEALKGLFDRYDNCLERTLLDEKILRYFSITEPPHVIPTIYGHSDSRKLVASIVPLAFAAVDEGDNDAQHILLKTAKDIAKNIKCLAPKLYSKPETQIPVVLTGGLFTRKDLFLPTIKEQLELAGLNCNLIVPTVPPIVGSVIAGLRMLKQEVKCDFIQKLNSSFESKEDERK